MTRDGSDAAVRREALDTTVSCHVESPAGSGKTLLLTTRFVKLLAQVDHPSEILALTFTEKAAREMRGRIASALHRGRRPGDPDGGAATTADEELLAAAREAHRRHADRIDLCALSGSLNIMTFHGFCFYLAARAPLEAGLNPECSVADESAQALLVAESTRRSIPRILDLPSGHPVRTALENRALYHDNNWRTLTGELAGIIRTRDRFADVTAAVRGAGGGDRSRVEATLHKRIRSYVEHRLDDLADQLARTALGSVWTAFVTHLHDAEAEAAQHLPRTLPGPSWEELPLWRDMADILLTKEGKPRKRSGPKSGFYAGFQNSAWGERLAALSPAATALLHDTRHYPDAATSPVDMDVLSDLVILSGRVIGDYEDLCRSRSVVDFIGLEQCALRVLDTADPSDLALFLDHRLKHILIDEFQDTNRIQWDLLGRLMDGWEAGDGRTVFIVGDPKQSIYSFRNAEVQLFYEARRGIPRSGQEPLVPVPHRLAMNFRSSAPLIEWTNRVFGNTVMAAPDPEADEVPYAPSTAAVANRENGAAPAGDAVSLALFAGDSADRNRAAEADWLAATVRKLVLEGDGETIGILLYTRNHLTTYLAALARAGVPVQVQEGLGLAERPEVRYLLTAARLLAHPHDDLAWASLLRSPWSWFDLSLLVEAALSPEPAWIDKIRSMAPSRPDMARLTAALDRAVRRIGRDPLGSLVQTLWEDLDGPRVTAKRYGMAGVANCIRFCDILKRNEEGIPQDTLARVESLLDRFYEPTDPTTTRSPVHMMTVHRAKGLEFDVTIIPFMDWNPLGGGSEGPPPYRIERIPGSAGSYLIATAADRRSREPDLLYRLLARFETSRRWGEAKRLFYVAATRARSRLIMSAVADLRDGIPRAVRKSPLSWLLEDAGAHISGTDFRTTQPEPLPSGLSLSVNPPPPETVHAAILPDRPQGPLPVPLQIEPEHPTLSVTTPAAAGADDGDPPGEGLPAAADRSVSALRGITIHRVLKTRLDGKAAPSVEAVARTLTARGLPPDDARRLAPGILEEAARTMNDPCISGLLAAPDARVYAEWKLERALSPASLASGAIDLVIHDGAAWWVIDFKTGAPAPGDDRDAFIAAEAKRYGGQIEAYRAMVAASLAPGTATVRAGLYFTALNLWHECEEAPR